MTYNIENEFTLHHSGAIVRNNSPFDGLVVPSLGQPLSRITADKWVVPFYRNRLRADPTRFTHALKPIFHELDDDLIVLLLSEFNWRPRVVGAYFAAISKREKHEEHIGKLLLRSDFCYAGLGYCTALAQFNTQRALNYLTEYLEYYLTQTDLYFDQGYAMAAIAHLDSLNSTDVLRRFMPKWASFIRDKTTWNLDSFIQGFSNQMRLIYSVGENVR